MAVSEGFEMRTGALPAFEVIPETESCGGYGGKNVLSCHDVKVLLMT
jgi:hypothetical protein